MIEQELWKEHEELRKQVEDIKTVLCHLSDRIEAIGELQLSEQDVLEFQNGLLKIKSRLYQETELESRVTLLEKTLESLQAKDLADVKDFLDEMESE